MKISIRVMKGEGNELSVAEVTRALPTIDGVVPTVEDVGEGYCQDVVYKMNDDFKYWDLLPILKASGVNGSMNSKGKNPYIFLQHEQTDNGNETLPEFYDTMDNMERREALTGQELLDEMKSIDIKRWCKSISTGALDGHNNNNFETVDYAIRNLGFDTSSLREEDEFEDECCEIEMAIEEYMFNSHYIDRIEELEKELASKNDAIELLEYHNDQALINIGAKNTILQAIKSVAESSVHEGYFDGGYFVPDGADNVYYTVLDAFDIKEPTEE